MEDISSNPSTPLLTNKDENCPVTFCTKLWEENKMVWQIAGPSILISIFQFSLAFVTQTFVGHLGTLELAAVGLQNLVVSGIGFGVLLGMGSAAETLCGQAYGAGKMRIVLGVGFHGWLLLICLHFFACLWLLL